MNGMLAFQVMLDRVYILPLLFIEEYIQIQYLVTQKGSL